MERFTHHFKKLFKTKETRVSQTNNTPTECPFVCEDPLGCCYPLVETTNNGKVSYKRECLFC